VRDETLAEDVRNELDWDPKVDPAHISVIVEDGAVTLSGFTSSYAERWAAVSAAERVYGVQAVADEIEVRLPDTDAKGDSAISEALQRSFDNHVELPMSVQAVVRDGVVTLTGEVGWRYQRSEAERLARHTRGVKDVVNRIDLKPKATAVDVEQRVGAALRRSADLDARAIWATVDDGTVHLHGHVHSFHEKEAAEDAAFAAPGVSAVDNQITISP